MCVLASLPQPSVGRSTWIFARQWVPGLQSRTLWHAEICQICLNLTALLSNQEFIQQDWIEALQITFWDFIPPQPVTVGCELTMSWGQTNQYVHPATCCYLFPVVLALGQGTTYALHSLRNICLWASCTCSKISKRACQSKKALETHQKYK